MYHVALTPNENPDQAISAQAKTLLGALGNLFRSLDALELDDFFVERVLDALREAVENLELGKPATGEWSDMDCDDAFSVDIFTSDDDARFVLHDGKYWLAPHGAVALAIGEHNFQRWIYEESEVAEWDTVLRPTFSNPEAGLDEAVRSVVNPTLADKAVVCRQHHLVDCDDNDAERYVSRGSTGKAQWDASTSQWRVNWKNGASGFYTHDELENKAHYADIPDTPIIAQPTIIKVARSTKYGECTLMGVFSDGIDRKLFSYYVDELSFSDDELIGLTESQAQELRSKRDAAYLRS